MNIATRVARAKAPHDYAPRAPAYAIRERAEGFRIVVARGWASGFGGVSDEMAVDAGVAE